MNNLTEFKTIEDYEKNLDNLYYPNVSFIKSTKQVFYRLSRFNGSIDNNILVELGWSQDDIDYFNRYGINWNKENDNLININNFSKKISIKSKDISRLFSDNYELIGIPNLNTHYVTDMSEMFYNCSKLSCIPKLDTSNVVNINNMFTECSNLRNLPLLDTSNVINMNYTFYGCSNLTKIPKLNTKKVTSMDTTFSYCSKLVTIPELDTSNVTSMNWTFEGCESLTSLPKLNVSNVTNMESIFDGCTKLETIGGLVGLKCNIDLSTCYEITRESILNIIREASNSTNNNIIILNKEINNRLKKSDIELAVNKGWKFLI